MREVLRLLGYARRYTAHLLGAVVLMTVAGASTGMIALLIGPILYTVLDPAAIDKPVELYSDPIFHHKIYLSDFFSAGHHNVWTMIAFAILGSVLLRRPLMSAGLKPFMTKGEPHRSAAWDRLSAASPQFRRLELLFSTIWGVALLAECAARLVGAYTLPVTTMVWLGTVITLGAIAVAIVAGGVAAGPIQKMIDAETAAS